MLANGDPIRSALLTDSVIEEEIKEGAHCDVTQRRARYFIMPPALHDRGRCRFFDAEQLLGRRRRGELLGARVLRQSRCSPTSAGMVAGDRLLPYLRIRRR